MLLRPVPTHENYYYTVVVTCLCHLLSCCCCCQIKYTWRNETIAIAAIFSIANKRQRFLNLPYSVARFVLSTSSCFLNNKRRQLYRWQQMWRTRRVLYYFTTGVVWCVCDYKKKRADRVVVIHLITLVDLSLTFPVLTVQFLWRGPLGGSFVVENNRHEGHPAWYSRQRRIECGMQSTLAEWVVVDVLHAALSFSLSIVARSRILLQNYSS
jgi:hypothetical protein